MNSLKVIGKEKIGSIEFTGIEGGFGKAKHVDKEVPQWLYFDEGLKFIKEHVEV